jgi:hypothetical protein
LLKQTERPAKTAAEEKNWFRWYHMIQRCHNPKHPRFGNYGGRGITVCDRWRASYEAFVADMGLPPEPGLTIDRRDNDRGYSPDNCRWATSTTQSRNKTTSRYLEHDGVRLTLTDWAPRLGLTVQGLHARLRRMSVAEALTVAKSRRGPKTGPRPTGRQKFTSVPGVPCRECPRQAKVRGLCNPHYQREYRLGRESATSPDRRSE